MRNKNLLNSHSIFFIINRNRIRQYPAFVNCTTIDWFSEWPHDALLEVAGKYLEDMNVGDETVCWKLLTSFFMYFISKIINSFVLNNYFSVGKILIWNWNDFLENTLVPSGTLYCSNLKPWHWWNGTQFTTKGFLVNFKIPYTSQKINKTFS